MRYVGKWSRDVWLVAQWCLPRAHYVAGVRPARLECVLCALSTKDVHARQMRDATRQIGGYLRVPIVTLRVHDLRSFLPTWFIIQYKIQVLTRSLADAAYCVCVPLRDRKFDRALLLQFSFSSNKKHVHTLLAARRGAALPYLIHCTQHTKLRDRNSRAGGGGGGWVFVFFLGGGGNIAQKQNGKKSPTPTPPPPAPPPPPPTLFGCV